MAYSNIIKSKYVLWGSGAIIVAALFWSIDGIFIRPSFYTLPAALVVFFEHLFGFIVLSPFVFINWYKIKSLSKKSWVAIFWVSVFGGVLGTLMITKAFFAAVAGVTTFATVVILQKLQPIFALLLARLVLRERLRRGFYLWALVAIIASYFLAFAKTGLSLSSIDWLHNAAVFAFLAAFAFGSSTVFGKRIANHLDFRAVTALRFGITTVLVLFLVLINSEFAQVAQISSVQWQLFALIVVTSGAGAMFLYYFGLRYISASTSTILELFWPFSAIILDYIFNHNSLNSLQWLAFVILLLVFYKATALGRLHNIRFKAAVIKGRGKGKLLGYPTANLDNTELDIPHGIYIVKIKIQDKEYSGLMHFGFIELYHKPVSAEVLIKDFDQDIYGQSVSVKVIKKIREVKKFKDTSEMSQVIENDLLKII